MSSKGNYSRYFIILQEDEKGYSIGNDKFPTGYAKIEKKTEKCKISFYVQNLKKSQGSYYMVLICNKKSEKKLIKLGTVSLDQYGRSDISLDYDSRNIGKSDITIDKIKGAAIVKFIDTSMVSVLCGFVNGSSLNDWKTYPLIENREDKEEKIVEDYKEAQQRSSISNRNDESSEDSEKSKEDNVFDDYEKSIETSKKKEDYDEKEDSDEEDLTSEDMPEEEENKEKNDDYEDNDNEDYPKGAMGKFFMNIAHGFEEVSNFHKELGKCKWYKVKCLNMEDMNMASDYNKFTVVYYPMTCYYSYIKKYGHFLMGYKCNKKGYMKYIVYGIPGKKTRREQPFEGKTGFVTWVPCKEYEETGMGYWLMFYDFKNSCVVIPVK